MAIIKVYLYLYEANRLQGVQDNDYGSYYMYDNAGERSWKLTGERLSTTISGQSIKYTNFNQSTYYMFPEVTVNNTSYVKHIFAGTERICSKAGRGMAYGVGKISILYNPTTALKAAKKDSQLAMLNRRKKR